MTSAEKRLSILNQAADCVSNSRCKEHGDAEDNLKTIAELWEAYLGARSYLKKINAEDVAAMMSLVKLARIASNPHNLDNWVDLCGYGACGGGIAIKEIEREQQPKTDRVDLQKERIRVSVDGESGGCCAIREDDGECIEKVVGSLHHSDGS